MAVNLNMVDNVETYRPMSELLLQPVLEPSHVGSARWMVVIFNNDETSMDDVVLVLMAATGCDVDEAYMEMWEAHHYGKAPVNFAPETECHEVARVIATVGVKTSVQKEWED